MIRSLLLRRLLEDRYARRRGSGYGRRSRGRGRGRGHLIGPFPAYSRRTRGGSRVTVTGCCLPIPLSLALAPLAARAILRSR